MVGKQKRLFEPITNPQIEMIFARTNEISLPEEDLYSMITTLIGLPSVRALGKNEASYIIDRLMGPTKWLAPPPARTAEQIDYDSSNLPSYKQIFAIRMFVKDLGWDVDHFYNWLKKYVKKESIRELDRESAHKAYIGLLEVLKRRN